MPLERRAGDVVLFSTADWDHPFWTNKQHVAAHLGERGYRVLYVESLGLRRPTAGSRDLARMARRLRRARGGVRQVRENIWVASPLAIPWHGHAVVRRLNEKLLSYWLTRQIAKLKFHEPIFWTYNPLLGPLAARLPHSQLVYHAVDDLRAAPHMAHDTIEAAETSLAREADVVFTTSPALQERLHALNPRSTFFLPNVADYDHFSRARQPGTIPSELAAIPRPRIGFVGALSEYKVDFQRIAAVARARPDWHWVLIGQIGEGQPGSTISGLDLPNVHVLGPRAYEALPDYLRGFDVATIPCPANNYTAAMFPMKFFEYLSAGLGVVASNVAALRQYSDACELVDSDAHFIAAITRILAGEGPDAAVCQELAKRHTWHWRMQEMLAILASADSTIHPFPGGKGRVAVASRVSR